MLVLGVNAYHGDSSAVLLRDGKPLAAVEEERFNRVKHWAGFPAESVRACLKMAGVSGSEVGGIALSRNPHAHLLRKALYTVLRRPDPAMVLDRLKNASRVRGIAGPLAQALGQENAWVEKRLRRVEHHPAHLASAFFVSPFEEAAVCAVDGFGDFVSTSTALGRGGRLHLLDHVYFPHSIGLLYLALTQYLGFPNYGDEYKVMGLAPYGKPEFADKLRRVIRPAEGGGFLLDLRYFRHAAGGFTMTWDGGAPVLGPVYTRKLEDLLGPARRPEDPIEPRHEAIAASLQAVFEESALHVLNHLHRRTRTPRLCLAGGCAMNSVLNGKIREKTPFKELFIQPAAADNGTALGAACFLQHQLLGMPRSFVMEHAYLGPAFGEEEISAALRAREPDLRRAACRVSRHADEEELCRRTAAQIAEGKVVGWFQGAMEWGARALGNRSILADPRRREMREVLNTKIKLREKFRPFAPAVTEESLNDYFVGAVPDPFMIQVYPVRPEKRAVIPAVTHVDGTGRLQTVGRSQNPRFWNLLKAFEAQTGVPVLLNTSFNENEPIVLSPEEALDCFLRTQMDVLVLGQTVVEKNAPKGPGQPGT